MDINVFDTAVEWEPFTLCDGSVDHRAIFTTQTKHQVEIRRATNRSGTVYFYAIGFDDFQTALICLLENPLN